MLTRYLAGNLQSTIDETNRWAASVLDGGFDEVRARVASADITLGFYPCPEDGPDALGYYVVSGGDFVDDLLSGKPYRLVGISCREWAEAVALTQALAEMPAMRLH